MANAVVRFAVRKPLRWTAASLALLVGRASRAAIVVGLGSVAVGCWASDPCEPGQVVRFDSCFPGPVATADASGEGGAGEGGSTEGGASDGGAVPSSFGKT